MLARFVCLCLDKLLGHTICYFLFSCPHFPAVHVAHIQGCGDVQHEALEAETEKEEHHGEDDVPQLTAGDLAWLSQSDS